MEVAPLSRQLLVISNGAGEDAIAASVLRGWSSEQVGVFPLIGEGRAYAPELRRWGQLDAPPSQGLSNQSWRLWLRDLQSGLLARVAYQVAELRRLRAHYQQLLAVGDLLPCLLAGAAGWRDFLFLGTAKSIHHHAYSWPERWLLQRLTRMALVRDEPTAERLRHQGVRALYLGNPMMDETLPEGKVSLPPGPRVLIFPGSRAQAAEQLPRLLDYWRDLQSVFPCQAAVALAPGFSPQPPPGWQGNPGQRPPSVPPPGGNPGQRPPSVPPPGGNPGFWTSPEGLRVELAQGALGDLLQVSTVALGVAGTAHEQAVGAGVPVVAPHQGKLGWYRGRQKGLLGDALWVVPERSSEVVAALARLLSDPQEHARRAAVGRERMGLPGGAERISSWIREQL